MRGGVLVAVAALFVAACTDGTSEPEPSPSKRIALSFDDAPMSDTAITTGTERTQKIIDGLASVGAPPVAIFVTTRGLDRSDGRQRIEAYAAAGHILANHSDTHLWASRVAADQYIADIDMAREKLEGFDNLRPWYRYPYLDEGRPREKREEIASALTERGLMNGYVTVDNFDWYVSNLWHQAVRDGREVRLDALKQAYIDMILGAATFYDDAAKQHLGRSPAHVLLLHENDLAAEFIDDLVIALRADGWELISPDEAYEDEIAQQIPVTMRTGQGRVMALAVDAGADPTTFSHMAIDEAMIDAFLIERDVFGSVTPSE